MRNIEKEEFNIENYSNLSIGELYEVIGYMEDRPPRDKRTKEYAVWKQNLNSLFDLCNKKIGSKIYKKIK